MIRPFSKKLKELVVDRGFTLIETLVAITVLMLAVTGPLVISQKGLSAAGYAKDQMIAYYLAQDAMEYVRNVRDANVLGGIPDWLSVVSVSGVLSSCNIANCRIDTRPSLEGASGCSGTGCLLTKSTNGFDFQYGHTIGDTATPFSRPVKIEKPDGSSIPLDLTDKEARVTVTVSWQTFSGQRNITLVENLFKQQ